jgi:hypothetical protein
VSHIEELRGVIEKLHGAKATHVESVPVKEVFQGKTVWDGIVEVFELHGHQTASRVYAWAHATEDPANPKRHVTVLHFGPIGSAIAAVRAVIVKDFRDANPIQA